MDTVTVLHKVLAELKDAQARRCAGWQLWEPTTEYDRGLRTGAGFVMAENITMIEDLISFGSASDCLDA